MGVTIHFEGQLRSAEAFDSVVAKAQNFAVNHGWAYSPFELAETHLSRVRDEQDWDYVGSTRGVVLFPHEDSEPVRLEFDRDLYIQEYTKTQFAGTAVHVRVVELLRLLAPHFGALTVEDEGEFWETSDHEVLERHFQAFFRALAGVLPGHPGARVKVRLASGRIADFIT